MRANYSRKSQVICWRYLSQSRSTHHKVNDTQKNIHLRQICTNKFLICVDNNTTLYYDMDHKVSGGGNMDANEKKSKPKSKEYPAVTLDAAIAFVEKFRDYPQNKPISYDVAAEACGVKATTNSFKYTLSSARQYGLISTSSGKTISFLEPARRFARPTEGAAELQALKFECFKAPKLYSELIAEYTGQSIPQPQTLENILVNQYGILPAVAKVAANTFIKTATEIGAVQNGILDLTPETPQSSSDVVAKGADVTLSSTATLVPDAESVFQSSNEEFAAPLNISFGDKRRAILYMPIDATQDDAEYVKAMIALMFQKVYGVK